MDARERIGLAQPLQAALHLEQRVGVLHQLGAVLSNLAQRRARVVPEAVTVGIAIEVRRGGLQRAQRVVEHGDVLAGLHRAQTDVRAFDATHGLPAHVGGAAQHHGARDAARREEAAVAAVVAVIAVRDRLLAVHLGVDDRVPVVVEVAGELVAYARHVERERARHDHRRGVPAHPQLVDDCGHQAQHAAGALEALEGRPVLVEAVEHLGVYRVTRHHALAVLQLARLRRELSGVLSVHLAERDAHLVARDLVLAVEEEPAAHHLEALASAHWLPDRLHAAEGMLDLLECALAGLAADLVVGLGDGGDDQAALRGARSLGELLDEGYEVVERARGQLVGAVEFLGVGHKLVHEDQAASARVEQVRQGLRSG